MGKMMTAEYDAKENTLRLVEPLEGIPDHAKVGVLVSGDPTRPWLALENSLDAESGESLSRAIEELFGDDE